MASSDTRRSLGLDTSVVLRLLTGKPEAQARSALAFLKEAATGQRRVVVSDLVVSEAYFALQYHYKVPKKEASRALLDLLRSPLAHPQDDGVAIDVLEKQQRSSARPGLLDRMIHAQYARMPATLVSFERASRKLSGAIVLGA